MINSVILLGKPSTCFYTKHDGSTPYSYIKVRIQRSYQNSQGIFQEDVFTLKMWKAFSEQLKDRISDDSILAVKGRIEKDTDEEIIINVEKISII